MVHINYVSDFRKILLEVVCVCYFLCCLCGERIKAEYMYIYIYIYALL